MNINMSTLFKADWTNCIRWEALADMNEGLSSSRLSLDPSCKSGVRLWIGDVSCDGVVLSDYALKDLFMALLDSFFQVKLSKHSIRN